MIAILTIEFDENSAVKVSGPIDNKILCYGMLEMARDAIKDFKLSPIIKPDMKPVINLNGK